MNKYANVNELTKIVIITTWILIPINDDTTLRGAPFPFEADVAVEDFPRECVSLLEHNEPFSLPLWAKSRINNDTNFPS